MVHLIKHCWPRLLVLGCLLGASHARAQGDPAAELIRLRREVQALREAGKYDEAIPLAEQLVTRAESVFRDQPANIAIAVSNLAGLYMDQGRATHAEPLYQRALAIMEQALGPDHPRVAHSLNNLAQAYLELGRPMEAEPLYQRALTIWEKARGPDDPEVVDALNNLAAFYSRQHRYGEAEPLYQRALRITEQALGPDALLVADSLRDLVALYYRQGRYAEAEPLCRRALRISEQALGEEHTEVATLLTTLGNLRSEQGDTAGAEPLYQRALRIREQALGPDHADVAASLESLAIARYEQGRFAQAQPLFHQALRIKEKVLGPDHPELARSLNNLAVLYTQQGYFAQAEALYQRALGIREKAGADRAELADELNNLAGLYGREARFAEAEALYRRALQTREKALGPEHPDVAASLNNLANLYKDQGRYADAEPLYQRALRVWGNALGSDHPLVAMNLNNLGELYREQGRHAEAEALYQWSLRIKEQALPPEHPDVAMTLNNLGLLYEAQARYAEAEPLYQRALRIREKALGGSHPDVAATVNNLAILYRDLGRGAEAVQCFQRSLAIREQTLGANHPAVAASLSNLASLYAEVAEYALAEPLAERALAICQRSGAAPGQRLRAHLVRAEVRWGLAQRSQALADMRQALDLAELQRTQASGGESERAQLFGVFASAYERMVAWQREVGDVAQAFQAAERSRARALLDQMAGARVDLLTGVAPAEADRLREQESLAQQRAASLEKQLDALAGRRDLSAAAQEQERGRLEHELALARQAVVEAFAAIRNASPAYRRMVGRDFQPAALADVQERIAGRDRLVLEYLLGEKAGYVFVIPPLPQPPRLETLSLSPPQAARLGVEAGPLTERQLKQALINDDGSGVLQLLRHHRGALAASEKLAVLWQALLPEAERHALTSGALKQLIVVPDGVLAMLPFDALVVESGETPRYLLDAGPPVLGAPSATLLLNLLDLPSAAPGQQLEPVLTVADPAYPSQPAEGEPSSARRRYVSARGDLQPLPYSGLESSWVAEVFAAQGLEVGTLRQAQATERAVHDLLPGRRVVHLACHGVSDFQYGNLFGALAFAPGAADEGASDDGFLTLAEIYALDLRGTELSILSACDTNVGPQQRGEGVWALSRGFLVAGSRRVVASNWRVDDEAAASLVSFFCGGVAKGEKSAAADYAAALQKAKRWVRQQEKWKSPYYWGTFTLVGPG